MPSTSLLTVSSAQPDANVVRRSVFGRYCGNKHGPLNRLFDPDDLGRLLKPFILLDYFNTPVTRGFGFDMHPHSGLATLTWQPGCDASYEDTTGQKGILKAGGLEWMNAASGVWHKGHFETDGMATGFQLWVAMPPSVEDGEPGSQYVPPEDVPVMFLPGGLATVLLGSLDAGVARMVSPIHSYQDMNYFVLELDAGSSFTYAPPTAHTVAWAFPFEGTVRICGEEAKETLLVMSDKGVMTFEGVSGHARILVGSARPHQHDLVLGSGSVHTNSESLRAGQLRIREIGAALQAAGRL